MDVPVFKSEGQRQAYWKKQRMLELQLDEANDSKISKAYHDVDFGVIPAIRDTRSIKEIEQDTNLQRTLAKKNALTLMADDGYAADRLLALIGKQNHVIFNRFAPDIIEKLRNQIGRIDPVQAQRHINAHITTQTNPAKMIPPTAEQLTNLMTVINQRFGENNEAIRDVLLKLEAYRAVLASGSAPKFFPENLPTGDDINDALDEVTNEEKDDNQALRDLTTNMHMEMITRATLEELYDEILKQDLQEVYDEAAYDEALNQKTQEVYDSTMNDAMRELYDEMQPDTPADEETKGGDDEEETKRKEPNKKKKPIVYESDDDDDNNDDEPKGDPKDDDDEYENEMNELFRKFNGNIDNLRKDYRWVGNYYLDMLFQTEDVDYDPKIVDVPAAAPMRKLLKAIDIVPESALTAKNVRDIYKENEPKIKDFLDNFDPDRMYTRSNTLSDAQLLEGLKDRLANFQYIKFDPDRPNPGKIKGYPKGAPVLFANAQLYKDLYIELTDDVNIKSANVKMTRGGKETTEKINSASDTYFKYKALQEMATGRAPRTDKHLTYGELKRILEMPIYRQTYEKIQSDDLAKIGFYMPPAPTGSGFRRRGRRGRRGQR